MLIASSLGTSGLALRIAERGAILALLVLLGGCAPWPASSHGGYAERHETDSEAIEKLDRRFEVLLRLGASEMAAARTLDVKLLLVRARREYAGELYSDYFDTIAQVDFLLARLERDLGGRRMISRQPDRS
jgi:hypothetical protein